MDHEAYYFASFLQYSEKMCSRLHFHKPGRRKTVVKGGDKDLLGCGWLVLRRKADLKRLPMPERRGGAASAVLVLGVLGSDWSITCCVDRFDLQGVDH